MQHAVAVSVVGQMGPLLVANVSVHLFTHVYTARKYRAKNVFAPCGASLSSWARQSVTNVVLFADRAVVSWVRKDI